MWTAEGHDVILYAGDENDADCMELVPCITKSEQNQLLSVYEWFRDGSIYGVDWDASLPYWQWFNRRVGDALEERLEPRDIVCLTTGEPHRSLLSRFPSAMFVEYGVGYEGVISPYRVFESYAWMHAVYGKSGPSSMDGRFYDAVIPNYFEVQDFPFSAEKDDYFLYMSRMTSRKGYEIAIKATELIGAKLKIAGIGGDRPEYPHVEYVGLADAKLRGELMSRAQALWCPTLYLEPFGGVVVEAMLCGTPAITTDFGAFTETVRHGVDGFRCHTLGEFAQAALSVDTLGYYEIRRNAISRWSTEAVGPLYSQYFERLQGLYGDGFYTTSIGALHG
jgi:glycosyltransferase involved in cell wall biosynthesis